MRLVDSLLDVTDSLLDASDSLLDAAASTGANAFDMTLGSGIADLTPLPRSIIDEQPQQSIEHAHPRTYAQQAQPRGAANG